MKTEKKKATHKSSPKKLSLAVPAKNRTQKYDKDFVKWTINQANLLKKGAFEKLDVTNLIEEIESLGRNDKRSLKSQLTRLLMHMLKLKYQPEKQVDSNSWTNSIVEATREIEYLIEDSPSLINELNNVFSKSYEHARKDAARESGLDINKFPKKCPWSIEELFPDL